MNDQNDTPSDAQRSVARHRPTAARRHRYVAPIRSQNLVGETGFSAESPLPLWVVKITQPALLSMMKHLCEREPESGGILTGPDDDDLLITHFEPDLTGHATSVSFQLGAPELNRHLKRVKSARMNCKGIGHSQPVPITTPTYGDLAYFRSIFAAPGTEPSPFFVPIVCGRRLYPYVFYNGEIARCELVVI